MKNKVYAGQNFCDKVLENTGSIENVVAMAILNDAAITDDLVVASELLVTEATNKQMVSLFFEFNRPASAMSNEKYELIVADEGIGTMIIGSTFIIR